MKITNSAKLYLKENFTRTTFDFKEVNISSNYTVYDHLNMKKFTIQKSIADCWICSIDRLKKLGYIGANKYINQLNEALETDLIMKDNRSCYECKHWCQEFQAIGIYCKGIKEEKQFRESMTYSNFYCNKWELK